MDIYEMSYAVTVMCCRNIDALEERHAVCGEADEELYDIILIEFKRRYEIFCRIRPAVDNADEVRKLSREEKEFLYYFIVCSRGYQQWDFPKKTNEICAGDFAEYILEGIKKSCAGHERLTQDVMKKLNRGVHDRVYSFMLTKFLN